MLQVRMKVKVGRLALDMTYISTVSRKSRLATLADKQSERMFLMCQPCQHKLSVKQIFKITFYYF